MLKTSMVFWCSTLFAVTLCSADAGMDTPKKEDSCGMSPQHKRVAARYTTPQGIGYNNGYTTLEGFLAPRQLFRNAWLPFLNLRGHVFDNGKMAANAGLGLRYLSSSRIWGINSYYDYRNTTHQHYNQYSAGLESLGRVWDFRINGYLPVGMKHSHLRHVEFDRFSDHYMYVKGTYDFAMKGANAEAGFHLDHFKSAPLYFAAGPYYLTGKGESTWGGKFRASVDLWDHYVRLEANTAYDHFFKWTGQGVVSVNVPFGGRAKVKSRKGNSCAQAMTLATRIVQPVDRFEIIPVGKGHIHEKAVNPATHEPYYFVFVDNTSHSLGTYESPYSTLVQAHNGSSPGNIIYVFPGDGTTTGMDAGIALQDGQMLLGASVPHALPTTVGLVTAPPQAAVLPNITNGSGDIVTLANGNTVSGFYLGGISGNGISGTGISNFTANQNIFGMGSSVSGIYLSNPSGLVAIDDSTFNAGLYGVQLVLSGGTLDTISISNSSFSTTNNNFDLTGSGGVISTMNFTNNAFLAANFYGGISLSTGTTIDTLSVTENFFTAYQGVIVELLSGGSIETVNMAHNAFDVVGGYGVEFSSASSSGITTINVSDNSFCNEFAIYSTMNGSNSTFSILNNTFTGNGEPYITYTGSATGSNFMTISGNSFIGSVELPAGYAATISVTSGQTCLDFTGNNAMPIVSPVPYVFTRSGGTFNLTSGSDNSTNTGAFTLTGTIGSCSN